MSGDENNLGNWIKALLIFILGFNIQYLLWSYVFVIVFPVWLLTAYKPKPVKPWLWLVPASVLMDMIMSWPWGLNMMLAALIGILIQVFNQHLLSGWIKILASAGFCLVFWLVITGLLSLPFVYIYPNIILNLSAAWFIRRR